MPDASRRMHLALAAFGAVEAIGLALFVYLGRGLWFQSDEWEFLAQRTAWSARDLFDPHGNVHPSTLPLLVYRFLWTVFGLHTYRPYLLVTIVLHLVCALLLRVLIRRLGVGPWTATFIASLFVFFGAGSEDILWAFQMSFVGSVVFGLGQFLLADHDGPFDRRDGFGLLAGLLAMLCSAIAVATVFGVGVSALLRRGWRAALLHAGPLLVLYTIWWATLARGSYNKQRKVHPTGISDVVPFVARGVRHGVVALAAYGPNAFLLAAVVAFGLFVAWRGMSWANLRRAAAVPAGTLAAAVVFLAIAGFGRATTAGGDPSNRSRYLYIVAALMVPTIAVAVNALVERWRVVGIAACAVLLVGLPHNLQAATDYADARRASTPTYRRMFLTMPRLAVAKEVPRSLTPQSDPGFYYVVTVGWMLAGVANGRIPRPARVRSNERTMDEIRLSLDRYTPPARSFGLTRTCVPLRIGLPPLNRVMRVHLDRGQSLQVEGGSIQLLPTAEVRNNVFPLRLDAPTGFAVTTAIRPVDFYVHVLAGVTQQAQLCASTPMTPVGT